MSWSIEVVWPREDGRCSGSSSSELLWTSSIHSICSSMSLKLLSGGGKTPVTFNLNSKSLECKIKHSEKLTTHQKYTLVGWHSKEGLDSYRLLLPWSLSLGSNGWWSSCFRSGDNLLPSVKICNILELLLIPVHSWQFTWEIYTWKQINFVKKIHRSVQNLSKTILAVSGSSLCVVR